MSQYDIIIPAYNEAQRIHRTLDHYLRFFDDSVHYIVVLNGCQDNTLAVVQSMADYFPQRITIINIVEAIGKGGAIRAGWQQASAEWVGFVDADGATAPVEFAKLMQAAKSHDGAVASRFLPTAQVIQRVSWVRTLISTFAIRIIRMLFHLPYSDTQCGAKLFRRVVLAPLLPKFSMNNFLFDVELLWWLHQEQRDIIDVPTIWVDQPGSASLGPNWKLFSIAARNFFGVLALRLRLLKYLRQS